MSKGRYRLLSPASHSLYYPLRTPDFTSPSIPTQSFYQPPPPAVNHQTIPKLDGIKRGTEEKVTSDNGYESGSVSRESAVSTAQDQWVPQVRSIAVSASFEEILDPDPKEELNYSERTLQYNSRLEDDPLLSPMTTLCYDPPFDKPFREGYIDPSDPILAQTTNYPVLRRPTTIANPENRLSSTPIDEADYQTLMKLCGEGDANALDSFLSCKPDSLRRTGDAYLGVMHDIRNNLKKKSFDSINPQPTVITSPIVSAILGGNSECVRLLVEAGASVNSASGITDNMSARADCPLSCALRVDRMDVAEYLVSQGANIGEALMRLAGCTDRRLAVLLGVRLGGNVNVVHSRDPDIEALRRLISHSILALTPAPLETAFLLGRAFKLLSALRCDLQTHWERLGTACERFSVQLIDQCLSPQEVSAIMSREDRLPHRTGAAPIHDALYYGRDEFVSHPATYRMLQQRITRSKTGVTKCYDVIFGLLSPLTLPFISIISYFFCGIRRDSILRRYMYRVYSPMGIFASSLFIDFLFILLVACCCVSAKGQIHGQEIVVWVMGFGILIAEVERRKLLVWYYQFRFVCDLCMMTWLVSIVLIKLRLTTSPSWNSGACAAQVLYGILLVTMSIRFLSISRPLMPYNPLSLIHQLLPIFASYSLIMGLLYLVFNVAIHAAYTADPVTTRSQCWYEILFLSLHTVVSNPGSTDANIITGQVLFIVWVMICLFCFISFCLNAFENVASYRRSTHVDRKCSMMKLIMMYEGNHPIPAPFNLLTLPLALICSYIICSPCKEGIYNVVWGDIEDTRYHDYLNDKQDIITRVVKRLMPPAAAEGGGKAGVGVDENWQDAVFSMREDLYRLYNKLDSEGIKLDALQAVWSSFVNLQENLATLQGQVGGLVSDGEKNKTLLLEQNDRVIGISKLLENREERRSAGSGVSSGGRYSDI